MTMHVEVHYSPAPRQVDCVVLDLAEGSTLGQALQASGLLTRHALQIEQLTFGVWSRAQPAAHVLRDGDRVEVYRALIVDPKEARRLRYKQHLRNQAARPGAKSPATPDDKTPP